MRGQHTRACVWGSRETPAHRARGRAREDRGGRSPGAGMTRAGQGHVPPRLDSATELEHSKTGFSRYLNMAAVTATSGLRVADTIMA